MRQPARRTRLERHALGLPRDPPAYDTAARAVRDFAPIEEGKAGIYVCGLTVQSEPHVGHVRSAVNFDVLRRWLLTTGYDVTFIRNITDIDDKILIKAAEQSRAWYNLAYDMKRELDKAYDALHVLPPDLRARGHGARPGDARADRAAGRPRPRVRRRGRLRRRLLRRAVLAVVRRADPAEGRRHGGRGGRRPARQARPPRLRAVEGPQGVRAGDGVLGRSRGDAAARAGTSSAPRWRRSTSARPSTSTAAGSTCASPTTRTSRRSRGRPGTRSRRTGCTTRGSPPPARR